MIFNDFQIKQNRRIQKGFVKTLHSQNTWSKGGNFALCVV
jgi:hypothetical protein